MTMTFAVLAMGSREEAGSLVKLVPQKKLLLVRGRAVRSDDELALITTPDEKSRR